MHRAGLHLLEAHAVHPSPVHRLFVHYVDDRRLISGRLRIGLGHEVGVASRHNGAIDQSIVWSCGSIGPHGGRASDGHLLAGLDREGACADLAGLEVPFKRQCESHDLFCRELTGRWVRHGEGDVYWKDCKVGP